MSRLRVLTLTHSHPSLYPSGTAIAAYELHKAFRDQADVESLFVAGITRLHRPDSFGPALEAVGGRSDEFLLRVDGFDRLMLSPQTSPGWLEAVGQLLGSFKPDVVHLHHALPLGLDLSTVTARLRPRARRIMTLHDFHLICARDGLLVDHAGRMCEGPAPERCAGCIEGVAAPRMAIRERHVRGMIGDFDLLIAPSRFVRERHIAAGFPADMIVVVPNGASGPVDVSTISTGNPTTFGFFGNLVPFKGIIPLLRAWPEVVGAVPDARLRLYGDLIHPTAEFRDAFVSALAAAGGSVDHVGAYRRSELGERMQEVGWVVTPSTWHENQPLVILEAFAHRRPVLCSDTGALAELVPHGTGGLRFARNDPQALARCLIRCATEDGLLDELGRGIPSVPAWLEVAERHLELYSRAAGASPRGWRRLAA